MLRCRHCGAQNDPAQIYCISCEKLLKPVGQQGRPTGYLGDETGVVQPRRTWGTARFDLNTILVLTVRGHEDQPFHLAIDEDVVIGREHKDFSPTIDLTPFEAFERGVSRQHAILRRQNDTVVLIDLHSANNTFLNGQRLVPDDPRILRDGDDIRFGQLTLRVVFQDVDP